MIKRITRYGFIILLFVIGLIVLQKIKWLSSFTEIFAPKKVQIENTAILIKEINSLAQLITITAYNEVVVESVKNGQSVFPSPILPALLNIADVKKEQGVLVLIGKGKILAGTDLSKLTEKDITVQGDSVALRLPRAEILQVILNPSDIEVFEEKGHWSDDDINKVKTAIKNKLIAQALNQQILQKATAKSVDLMRNFLLAAGFKKTSITIAN